MPELSTLELMESVSRRRSQETAEAEQHEETRREELEELLERVDTNTKQLINFFQSFEQKVEVTNPSTFEMPDKLEVTSKDVVEAVEKLSDKIEEPDFSEVVEAIGSLAEQQQELMERIDKLDVRPEVKVAAPKVTVEKPDFKQIEKAIKEAKPEPIDLSKLLNKVDNLSTDIKKVTKTITELKFPVSTVPTDPLIMYVPADIDEVGDIKYYGHIMSNGMWYIRRKSPNGDGTYSFRMAFGSTNYSTNWTNRATLTNYNYWSE